TCNGHAELCERAYDEVVQVATHNSMSSPDVVQIWPEQDGTIREQLDAGVRALLIDTHYWPGVTAPDQLTGLEPTVPANVANRVFETGGDRLRPHDGVFLCHNNCALGGEPFADGLAQLRDFLVANPDEVVTLVVQDETSSADTTAEITKAGLEPFLYDHAAHDDWPTFGELIDAGERLIVFAENEGPPPSWYRNAFDDMQDTPFGFPTPDAMTCEHNRGADDATLLLMNHWVSRVAPDRATAAVVNAHDFVVDRARECEKARGRLPNFVAVDFYSIGDVVGAVDTLNGFGSGSEDT
ncbi:MAG TPA: hypothetical protein VFX21_06975, partial [Acidimicrobiia bacterium]|nr:hypothetical protein [Acidimicrobiia bacterium]